MDKSSNNYAQIKIIYEDQDFLIIDKPSGLLTHPVRSLAHAKGASPEDLGEATSNGTHPVRSLARPVRESRQDKKNVVDGKSRAFTLSNGTSPEDLGEATSNGTHPVNRQDKSESVVGWLLEKYPEIANVRDKYGTSVGEWTDLRPGIVHRLDRETSGLLLIAKNQPAFDYLKKLFAERKIKKTYLALVYGHFKNKSDTIETPLGKFGTRQTTRTHGKHDLKEKFAITNYKVLKEFIDLELPETSYSLLEISPMTGRTHQIRVHLQSIGHPVVCDPLYAGKKHTCPTELGRLFLHAQKLSFAPFSGTSISVESDLPPILENFLSKLTAIIKD
ncbi:MAG: RluA family pseudouridine synthase [Candidatus Yanofskybacteria bacterium]|nr:RluA family pseudouridine synthase [Candidatus Yanofskybacteria bacterium]